MLPWEVWLYNVYRSYIELLFYITLPEYCTPLKSLQSWELLTVEPGSTPELIPSNTNDCGSIPYTLLYQNQSSGKLEHLYDQDNHKVMTPPIYLNTSGIYCVYKQCESAQIDQCCKKLTGRIDTCFYTATYRDCSILKFQHRCKYYFRRAESQIH